MTRTLRPSAGKPAMIGISSHPALDMPDSAVFARVSKGNWFWITTPQNWLKKSAPCFHPIRSKAKTVLAHVFTRFASATYIYFELWLGHWIVCALCDWPEWLSWFWLYVVCPQTLYFAIASKIHVFTVGDMMNEPKQKGGGAVNFNARFTVAMFARSKKIQTALDRLGFTTLEWQPLNLCNSWDSRKS